MPLFKSNREKYLWLWVFLVFAAIYSTLFIGQPLAILLGNQNLGATIFGIGMVLVVATVIVYGITTKPSRFEFVIFLGTVAVYLMFFLRLGIPDRTHLIEYSVLAIFIHKALVERTNHVEKITMPAILSIVIAFLIGVLDEYIQKILPNRVFDTYDILFNGIAVTMAITSSVAFTWLRKLRSRS